MKRTEGVRRYIEAAEQGLMNKDVQEVLYYTCQKINERVMNNIQRLNIHKTGEMQRSLHWELWNASGGNQAIITFYFRYYAPFIELAVQKGFTVNDEGVSGRLPEMVYGKGFSPIDMRRQNERGQVLERKAKPFVYGAIRTHARILQDTLVKYYGHVAGVMMAYGWVPESATDKDSFLQVSNDFFKNMKYVKMGEKK